MSMFGRMFRFALLLVRGLVFLAVTILEAVLWVGFVFWGLVVRGLDVRAARRSLSRGKLHCPKGHVVPLENGTYECGECGFVYQGSILRCGNPECRATTPYVNCPECGLSVRNPNRYGRQS